MHHLHFHECPHPYLQRLEDQLNDQVDIHHTELANLKQEIGVLAAKEEMDIVEFRSKERSRDLHEQLEACQQKVCFLRSLCHSLPLVLKSTYAMCDFFFLFGSLDDLQTLNVNQSVFFPQRLKKWKRLRKTLW